MLFDLLHLADWSKIRGRRQKHADRTNQREIGKYIYFGYPIQNRVVIINESAYDIEKYDQET